MPASKFALPVENPSTLIRSRIRDKRIFEARFLCRRLGAEIGEREKAALEQELAEILAQIAQMQQQAREYGAQGQNNLAEALYRDIEQLAIDVPGLVEERKALAGADALVARITGKGVERKPQVVPRVVAPAEPDNAARPIGAVPPAMMPPASDRRALFITAVRYQLQQLLQLEFFSRLKRLPRLWLLAGVLSLVLILLLLFRGGHEEQPLSAALKPSLYQPAQKTPIQPLVHTPGAKIDQPEKKAEPSKPAVEEESPPSSSLKVGELQIKESARD